MPYRDELLAEVLVQEAVDNGIGARRQHAHHVTPGVDPVERDVRDAVKDARGVGDGVEDVERQPADAKDGSDPTEELDGPLQANDVALPTFIVAPKYGVSARSVGAERVGVALANSLLQTEAKSLADLKKQKEEKYQRCLKISLTF